jgi:hypothetical protein
MIRFSWTVRGVGCSAHRVGGVSKAPLAERRAVPPRAIAGDAGKGQPQAPSPGPCEAEHNSVMRARRPRRKPPLKLPPNNKLMKSA